MRVHKKIWGKRGLRLPLFVTAYGRAATVNTSARYICIGSDFSPNLNAVAGVTGVDFAARYRATVGFGMLSLRTWSIWSANAETSAAGQTR